MCVYDITRREVKGYMDGARGSEEKRKWGQRKTPVPRVWPSETGITGRVTARIPHALRDRLRKYVENTNGGMTTTDCLEIAIEEFLNARGY